MITKGDAKMETERQLLVSVNDCKRIIAQARALKLKESNTFFIRIYDIPVGTGSSFSCGLVPGLGNVKTNGFSDLFDLEEAKP